VIRRCNHPAVPGIQSGEREADMAERTNGTGTQRRETASLLAQALVSRIAAQVRRPAPAQLRPTIFVAVRRGEDPDWRNVVARSV
jgi:hypothetical protein